MALLEKAEVSSTGLAESVAWGYYLDSDDTASNFGQLSIHTSSEYEDAEQVFAGEQGGVPGAARHFCQTLAQSGVSTCRQCLCI